MKTELNKSAGCLLLGLLLFSVTGYGQEMGIAGMVVTRSGEPVEGVLVTLLSSGDSVYSAADGSFMLGSLAIGRIEVGRVKTPFEYRLSDKRLNIRVNTGKMAVRADIYSCSGRNVRTLFNGVILRGLYGIDLWERTPASGLYIVRISAGERVFIEKLALVGAGAGYNSRPETGREGAVFLKQEAVVDSLRFVREGFQVLIMPLETLYVDLGDVVLLKYPSCSITSPEDGDTVTFGDSVTIEAVASDGDGSIAFVNIYSGSLMADSLTYPADSNCSAGWNTVEGTTGPRGIRVVAVDDDGLTAEIGVAIEVAPPLEPLLFTYSVTAKYPHDPEAFTQGLERHDGGMYEGTGLYGNSSLRRVDLETGSVLQRRDVESAYFGEGITLFDGRIYQLTWRENAAFVYDAETFSPQDTFDYATEGWGLTHDDSLLIMSDGSSYLYFRHPLTFEEKGSVDVTASGVQVTRLNELELFQEKILANRWMTDTVAMIDPQTGTVLAWIDLAGLLTPEENLSADVLNGIACDNRDYPLWVTGKLWPWIFEVELIQTPR